MTLADDPTPRTEPPSSGFSRIATIAAVVAVLVPGIVGLRIATDRDRLEGHPNSVSNCDTPPGLR